MQGISLPTQTTILNNQSQAKVMTQYDILEKNKTIMAVNEYQQQTQAIYQKVGPSPTPIMNIQIVAVLLINEVETIFDFFVKKGDDKMNKVIDSVLGYLSFCGQMVDDIDRAYVSQICQLVFNQYSINGVKQVAKEVYQDTTKCMRKKAPK